ncbi:methyltransferase FGSG_00040 isoform X2 [Rhodamnia argentea]|uniref:Methyltransferase FGSG_00040 isoform X2 n=1 Tax=Rhodamnia argentea TaxID=178133 RepID=A0A8B8MU48_9MYRT|nr:methyltransferase FGSG_00040 isoform X2 [Rhodamnia argentea]
MEPNVDRYSRPDPKISRESSLHNLNPQQEQHEKLCAAAAQQQMLMAEEELLQELRSKANELFLREQWAESSSLYSQLIDLCRVHLSSTDGASDPDKFSKLRKSLCLALANRADASSKLRSLDEALRDCDEALAIESSHFRALVCKGKILLSLSKYSAALECFKSAASLDAQANGNCGTLNACLEKCKMLEYQSRTGNFDLSDWVASGFHREIPELAEYIGPVLIKKSEISGRGLFATKNIDVGTVVLVTRAIAIERGIVMGEDSGSGENKQLVMWKNFIDRVAGCVSKSRRTRHLISTLSSGEDEEGLEVPDLSIFRAEASERDDYPNEKLDMNKILGILDVNSLVEDAISAKVMGRNKDYYGVGLWFLASFVNHSCCPNARRLHVGNHLMVVTSRDVKAGDELTFPYFDVLQPPKKRREAAAPWGFDCSCKRCEFEEKMRSKQELRDIEAGLEGGMDVGGVVYRLEEGMRRWNARGREKGYLRASFWAAYSETYASEKSVKKWGRRIPAAEAVVDSVAEATGSDERVLKVLVEQLSSRSGGGLGGGGVIGEMEKALKLGRGIYGKVVKKQALRGLIEL